MQKSICILLLVSVILFSGCVDGILESPAAAVYPDLLPEDGPAIDSPITYHYLFMDGTLALTVPVDNRVYWGAQNADKTVHLYQDLKEEEWLSGYYTAFLADEDLSSLYDHLSGEFTRIRSQQSLDNDEYLELITVFVQSLPYETDAENIEPKFPVELIAEGRGDCDDKSLLLAALLAHEGYDVVLLYFSDESHMAVGVKSTDCIYKETGYAYIETTNVTFVGIAPLELEDGTKLLSDPLVIPVGFGNRTYKKCKETMDLHNASKSARATIAGMNPLLEQMESNLTSQVTELERLKTEMDLVRKSGRTGMYNSLVTRYNSLVDEYNRDLDEFNRFKEEYNRYVDLYNYINTHQYDRRGTHIWLDTWEEGV